MGGGGSDSSARSHDVTLGGAAAALGVSAPPSCVSPWVAQHSPNPIPGAAPSCGYGAGPVMGLAWLWGWPELTHLQPRDGGADGGAAPCRVPVSPPPPRAASIPCSVGRTPVVPHRRCPPGRSGDAVLFGGGRCPQTPFLTHSSTRGRYPWGKGGSGGRCSSLTASAPPEEHSYGVQPPPQHPPPRIYRG